MSRRVVSRNEFPTIYADPPWPDVGGAAKSKAFGPGKRGADNHYPVLKVPQIPQVMFNSGVFRPALDCHLYLWTTGTFLMKGGWVMEELGFRYVTCVPWVKTNANAGLGQYFRGKAEFLLFGVRGTGYNVRTDDRYVEGLLQAPRRKHSQKPEIVYDLIERRSKGPYLELFARDPTPRKGWTYWGDDV